jgi:group I intron endonuclease
MISGVYKIENKFNGKIYIGSSINIEKRFYVHKFLLNKGSHYNKHLQCAWNKNRNYFNFSILEECSPLECIEFEQYYLDYFKPFGNVGYNLCRRTANGYIPGAFRKSQSDTLKKKYKDGDIKYRIWSDWSDDMKESSINKIKEKTIKRYSDFNNKKGNKFLKIVFDNGDVFHYYGYKDLERSLNIGHSTTGYVINNKQGRLEKYNATIFIISKEEYHKVVGQK